MPLFCIRDDITRMAVDAIVNSANPDVRYASGVDRAIYQEAGEEELLKARAIIGTLSPGQVAVTSAFGKLRKHGVRHIIHTVGPQWQQGDTEDFEMTAKKIAECYRNSLRCDGLSWSSIAFPVISTGIYGFPKERGLQIAISEITRFLLESDRPRTVYLVVFDRDAYDAALKVFPQIESRIDDSFVDSRWDVLYPNDTQQPTPGKDPVPTKTGETFAEYLDRLIKARNIQDQQNTDEKYYEDASIYLRAGISKQTFHKIRTGKSIPTKGNVLKIALALKLNAMQMQRLVEKADHTWLPNDALEIQYLDALKNGFDRVMQL